MIRQFVDVTQTRGAAFAHAVRIGAEGEMPEEAGEERERERKEKQKNTVEKREMGDGDAMRWKGGEEQRTGVRRERRMETHTETCGA